MTEPDLEELLRRSQDRLRGQLPPPSLWDQIVRVAPERPGWRTVGSATVGLVVGMGIGELSMLAWRSCT